MTRVPNDPDLAAFVRAQDLGELLARRDAITQITRDDAAALTALVTVGDDEQAMANLLMYPELIPAPLRSATVLAALDGDADGYAALAAAIGIGRVEWSAEEQRAIGERLLHLSRTASAPTSAVAARSVEHVVGALGLTPTVEVLGELRSDERHNVLAALVNEFGADAVRAEAGYAGSIGAMSPDDVEDIERRLDGQNLPLPVDLAVLVHLPNLDEWDPIR